MGEIRITDEKLKNLYYDPKNSSSFSTEKKLKEKYRGKTDIKKWLKQQEVYSLHKPVRYKFPRRKTISGGIDKIWQMDLCDVQNIAKYNKNYKYLLTVIDIFSKFAWVEPIKRKSSLYIINGFKKILSSKRKPISIQTDKGGEFLNKPFLKFLSSKRIELYTTENYETKATIVERFNRTLKNTLWKYFTANDTKNYLGVLQDIVKGYNNSYHKSIKNTPNFVSGLKSRVEILKVFKTLYPFKYKKPRFQKEDRVRISKSRKIFRKGYTAKWSKEIFIIDEVDDSEFPVVYKLRDLKDEVIKGRFYEEEIQKFNKKIFKKLIKKKKIKNKIKYLVEWEAYKPEWVSSNTYYKIKKNE